MSATYIRAILRGRRYAMPARDLVSVLAEAAPLPVPFARPDVYGIVRYGDAMIAVLDPFGEQAEPARLALVFNMDERCFAYAADDVDGFATWTDEEIARRREETPGDARTPLRG